jgi:hypothetical protein
VLSNGTQKDEFNIGSGNPLQQSPFDTSGIPGFEQTTLGTPGADAWLIARDTAGNAAVASWNGPGYFRSAEGVEMRANGDGPTPEFPGPPELGQWMPNAFVQTVGANNPHGRYEMEGQSGYVQQPDGRRVENKYVSTFSDPLSSNRTCVLSCPLASDKIVVVTPDAQGEGGSIHCVGKCSEPEPGTVEDLPEGFCPRVSCYDPTENDYISHSAGVLDAPLPMRFCTARCDMYEEFAGNPGSETPNGYFQVLMLEDGKVASTTPQGDLQYCEGKDCGYVQTYRDANGNGGSGYCYGGGRCYGETTGLDGQRKQLECSESSCRPAVLLYPNPDTPGNIDKYGPNDGWACGTGVSGSGCVSNDPDHMLQGWGEPEPSRMPLFDPTYTRPAQDTLVDEKLAEDLKEFGVEEGDPLPPLNPSGVAELERYDEKWGTDWADQYRRSLRPLTEVEKASVAARAAAAESNSRYVRERGNDELPGLHAILDKVEQTGSDATLTVEERNLLATAQTRYPLLEIDRGIINGLNELQAQEKYIDANVRDAGAGILVVPYVGPGALSEELQEQLGRDAQGRPVVVQDGVTKVVASSTDEAAQLTAEGTPYLELTPLQKAQANAASITAMATVGHKETLRLQTNAYGQQAAAYTAGVNAFNEKVTSGSATQTDADWLDAEYTRLTQVYDGLEAYEGRILATEKLLDRQPQLPGKQIDPYALRFYDERVARGMDERDMADQLAAWDAFETRAADIAAGLAASRGAEDPLTLDVKMLAGTAALNYDTVLRDVGSRSRGTTMVAHALLPGTEDQPDKSNLRLLSLPSTGSSDMIHVLNSVASSPGYRDIRGANGKVLANADEDTIAHWASRRPVEEQVGRLAAAGDAKDFDSLNGLLEVVSNGEDGKVDQAAVDRALAAIEGMVGKIWIGDEEVAVINGYVVDPNDPDAIAPMVLFRVTDDEGTTKLVDATGGVFNDYNDYKQHNELADDQNLILPKNLMRAEVGAPGRFEEVDGHEDPTWKKVLITSGRVLGYVGTAALFASGYGSFIGAATVARVAGTAAKASFVASGGTFGGYAWADQEARAGHNQDTSWADPTGRQNWITMLSATGLLGVGPGLKAVGSGLKAAGRSGSLGMARVPRFAGAVRGLGASAGAVGAGAAAAGGGGFLYQYAESTISAISNWDSLSPAQRRDFKIDTGFGALGVLGGGLRSAGLDRGTVAAGVAGDPRPSWSTVLQNDADWSRLVINAHRLRWRTDVFPPAAELSYRPGFTEKDDCTLCVLAHLERKDIKSVGPAKPGDQVTADFRATLDGYGGHELATNDVDLPRLVAEAEAGAELVVYSWEDGAGQDPNGKAHAVYGVRNPDGTGDFPDGLTVRGEIRAVTVIGPDRGTAAAPPAVRSDVEFPPGIGAAEERPGHHDRGGVPRPQGSADEPNASGSVGSHPVDPLRSESVDLPPVGSGDDGVLGADTDAHRGAPVDDGDPGAPRPLHRDQPLELLPDLYRFDPATVRSTRVPPESERVYVRDGLLVRADTGLPLEEPPAVVGFWSYVLDEHGNFYVVDPEVGHLAVLGERGRVAAAGLIGIVPGRPGLVSHMNMLSGVISHGNRRQLQRVVEEQGLDLSRLNERLVDEHPLISVRPPPSAAAGFPPAQHSPVTGPTVRGGCVEAICAYGRRGPGGVDLSALPRGTLTDPTVARDVVQDVFNGLFDPSSPQLLARNLAAAPEGAEFVVWIWRDGESTSHMVYGRKSGGRMEFYDQRGLLDKDVATAALANTRLVLRRNSGTSGRGVDVSGVKPVGAIDGRADQTGKGLVAQPATGSGRGGSAPEAPRKSPASDTEAPAVPVRPTTASAGGGTNGGPVGASDAGMIGAPDDLLVAEPRSTQVSGSHEPDAELVSGTGNRGPPAGSSSPSIRAGELEVGRAMAPADTLSAATQARQTAAEEPESRQWALRQLHDQIRSYLPRGDGASVPVRQIAERFGRSEDDVLGALRQGAVLHHFPDEATGELHVAVRQQASPEEERRQEHLAEAAQKLWLAHRRQLRAGGDPGAAAQLERALDDLDQLGVTMHDPVGQNAGDSDHFEVIHFEQVSSLPDDTITRMVEPAVYIGGRLVKHGKVIAAMRDPAADDPGSVGVPHRPNSPLSGVRTLDPQLHQKAIDAVHERLAGLHDQVRGAPDRTWQNRLVLRLDAVFDRLGRLADDMERAADTGGATGEPGPGTANLTSARAPPRAAPADSGNPAGPIAPTTWTGSRTERALAETAGALPGPEPGEARNTTGDAVTGHPGGTGVHVELFEPEQWALTHQNYGTPTAQARERAGTAADSRPEMDRLAEQVQRRELHFEEAVAVGAGYLARGV